MPDKTILIMAGGTGGHIYPALAVADYLHEHGFNLCWLGTDKGLEARVVPQYGYPLMKISISGLRGKGVLRFVMAPWMLLVALWQVLMIIREKRPCAVLGMGGFASGPGGIAAWLMRVPLLIHEQNAIAGLTNRLLLPFAHTVMSAFPGVFNTYKKVNVIGNPVRADIANIEPPLSKYEDMNEHDLHILVLGGSLGALKLNELVPEALSGLQQCRFTVRHQCGEKHLVLTTGKYQHLRINADVHPFIEDMAESYRWADVVICRAGALTVAELTSAGVGSILIPFPHAVDDHQTENARYLTDHDAGLLLPESELSRQKLRQLIQRFCHSKQYCIDMAKNARALARPDATMNVARLCMEVADA